MLGREVFNGCMGKTLLAVFLRVNAGWEVIQRWPKKGKKGLPYTLHSHSIVCVEFLAAIS